MQGKVVDTPKINAALDLLQVHLPRMRQQIEAFPVALNLQNYGVDGLEKQQRELIARIPPIHDAVRNKLTYQDVGVSPQGQAGRQNESGD